MQKKTWSLYETMTRKHNFERKYEKEQAKFLKQKQKLQKIEETRLKVKGDLSKRRQKNEIKEKIEAPQKQQSLLEN